MADLQDNLEPRGVMSKADAAFETAEERMFRQGMRGRVRDAMVDNYDEDAIRLAEDTVRVTHDNGFTIDLDVPDDVLDRLRGDTGDTDA